MIGQQTAVPLGDDDISIHGRIDELELSVNGKHVYRDVAIERNTPDGKLIGVPFDKAWKTYTTSVNRPDSGERTLNDYRLQFLRFTRWLKKQHPKCWAMHEVTEDIAEEYASYLLRKVWDPKTGKVSKAPYSPGTFNKHISFLQLFYRVLSKKARVRRNPWSEIVRKREQINSRRELTVEELDRICNKAEGQLRTLLIIGIYTGLRLGDCCTLRWAEVDMARRLILRVPNKTARRKKRPVHIPIHPTLHGILDSIPMGRRRKHVVPRFARMYGKQDTTITKDIQQHLISCNIQTQKDGTGKGTPHRAVVEVGFHSLRHSFVSLCRQANAPLAVVEAIVGHSNPAMTRHYTHIGDLAASRAVACLPALLGTREDPVAVSSGSLSAGLKQVRWLLNAMSADSWRSNKDRVLTLLDELEEDVLASKAKELDMDAPL
jgi:integrase